MNNKNTNKMDSGISRIRENKVLVLIPISYMIIMALIAWRGYDLVNTLGESVFAKIFKLAYLIVVVAFEVLGIVKVLIKLGTPMISKRVEKGMAEIGFVDKLGETPVLLSKKKEKNGYVLEFYSPRLPFYEYESHREEIETVMNIKIISVDKGKDMQHVKVRAIEACTDISKLIPWNDSLLDNDDFTIKVGESYFGEESFDLANPPHCLIGGGSGSGKSILLKLILMQCIKKGATVYLADFKGGVDYSSVWHKRCSVITEASRLANELEQVLVVMEERRHLFVEAGTPNIHEYNNKMKSNLERIIFACDEVAEVLDKTGLDKEEKAVISQIESRFSTIARQGRAFGIHLIFAMQRPDAEVLKGQIKSNIGLRICGRADKVLSQIILDNTEGADKISQNDEGMFVTNTGVLFKAYYVQDSCLEEGLDAS